MTILVTAPTGATIQFPDGTSPDTINAVMEKHFGGAKPAEPAAPSEAAKPAKAEETDPYRIAARKEIDDLKAKGAPMQSPTLRRILQGASFNTADEILAGLRTPLEMIKQGTMDPREAYRHAKAKEDILLEDARDDTGVLGTAAEIAGGLGSGAGLVRGGASLVSRLAPNANILTKAGASAIEGAGLGGASGFAEGNSLDERLSHAGTGAFLGGGIGGVAPLAASAVKVAASPVISNIRARMNPEGFAESQVARGVQESSMTPAQVAQSVGDAAREGQGMFTVADALGNSGQRMLSTAARSPGRARTDVVEFLDNRQAGQGRRVANALTEGFEAPETAAQARARLTSARDAAADAEYGAVRHDAQPVDVSNVIAHIDDTLSPFGVAQNVAANDTAAGALARLRAHLTDGTHTANDFNLLQRVRGDLSDAIQQARQAGQGNRARLLGGALRELDTSLENASGGFRQANANFRNASRDIEAIDTGRTAALRGRTEDIVPEFQALRPEARPGYRTGYADSLIEQAQSAAYGANKARPLTNDAFRDEAAAIAPGNALMQRRLARENTMFQTRNAATGNSKTAENLADDAAMGVDPGLVMNVLSGNYGAALRGALAAGQNAWSGNTPAVREAVARILLQRGQNVPPQVLQQLLDRAVQRIENIQRTARVIAGAGRGGVAVAPEAYQR